MMQITIKSATDHDFDDESPRRYTAVAHHEYFESLVAIDVTTTQSKFYYS